MLWSLFVTLCAAQSWEHVDVDPPLPSPRAGHSLNVYNGELYLFGGCNLDEECYNDLHRFNKSTEFWELLEVTGEMPEPREGHSATLVGNKIYVFGGSSLTELLEDVFIIDLESLEASELELAGQVDPRAYHSAALFDAGLIVIFGGDTEDGKSDQLLLLDTIHKHWGKPATVGEKPAARKLATLNRFQDLLWLFGGETDSGVSDELFSFNLAKKEWAAVQSAGSPFPRHGHSAVLYGDAVYVTGGCDYTKTMCYSDLYLFYPGNLTWSRVDAEDPYDPREAHATHFIGETLYVFGGRFFLQKVYGDFLGIATGVECPNDCSSHGECTDTGCVCDPGFTELDCSVETKCKMDCSNHGVCDEYECSCYPGYYGSYCQGYVSCPLNCTSGAQGVCQDSGVCECFEGYSGDSCTHKEPIVLCEESCENGSCSEDGKCNCDADWVGVNCDIEAPVVYSKAEDSDTEESSTVSIIPEDAASSIDTSDDEEEEDEEEEEEEDSVEVDLLLDDFPEGAYINLTTAQDYSASIVDDDISTHIVIPEMFGFADTEIPFSYTDETLRSDPEDEEALESVVELEEKQEDRINDINSCELFCNYHGVCYDALCYCEEGYTGELCELAEEDIDVGIKLGTAIIILVAIYVVSCCVGIYVYCKILNNIRNKEEQEFPE